MGGNQKITEDFKGGRGVHQMIIIRVGGGDGKVGSTIAQEMSQRKLSSTQFLEIKHK